MVQEDSWCVHVEGLCQIPRVYRPWVQIIQGKGALHTQANSPCVPFPHYFFPGPGRTIFSGKKVTMPKILAHRIIVSRGVVGRSRSLERTCSPRRVENPSGLDRTLGGRRLAEEPLEPRRETLGEEFAIFGMRAQRRVSWVSWSPGQSFTQSEPWDRELSARAPRFSQAQKP